MNQHADAKESVSGLTTLLAMPMLWANAPPEHIAGDLLDVLLKLMDLDLAQVRLPGPGGFQASRLARHLDDQAPEIVAACVRNALTATQAEFSIVVPALGTLQAARALIGREGDGGFVIVASRRAEFPTDSDRLLLHVAVNQATTALQTVEHEQRYRSLVSAGAAVLWTADPDGTFATPQAAWSAYTGQSWVAHQGFGWMDAVHPDDRQRITTLWNAALANGSPYESRRRIWHDASRTYRYFVSRGVPIVDRDGSIREWVGTLTDVDEQARAEAAQREYGALSAFAADVGAALVQRDPLGDVLQRCAESIVLHLGAVFARIWTLNDEGHVLELHASAGHYTHLNGRHSRVPIGQLEIGLIAAERKPHLTNDVIGDSRIPEQQWASDLGLVAFAGYPLLVDERLVGVMAMFARRPLSGTTLDALAAVANSVALGIERKRTEELAAEHARVMQTLNRVGAAVASELDRDKIVQAVTDAATELTDAAFGAFFYQVVSPESGESSLLHKVSGAPKEAFANFPDPRATTLYGITFRGEGVVRIGDVMQDPRYGPIPPHYGIPAGHLPVRSYLAVPVKARNREVMGGLFFGHPGPGVFSDQHERLAVGIASWASVALENAHLYEQAQDVSRAKDEFLAVLSHELRTPLNAILGWARMLRDGHVASARVQHALSVIERNARLQTQLVEDLLDVSRIVTGKLRLDMQPIDLPAIVQSAIDGVRPATTNKNIQMKARIVATVGTVHADADRIEQVVWNLLTNAVKFTESGGEILVDVRPAGSVAEVVVSDTGQGIAPDFLPHVFDRFRQAEGGTSRKHGGLGLGLALVRALTEAHGGTVDAKSAGPAKAPCSRSACRCRPCRSAKALRPLPPRVQSHSSTDCVRSSSTTMGTPVSYSRSPCGRPARFRLSPAPFVKPSACWKKNVRSCCWRTSGCPKRTASI